MNHPHLVVRAIDVGYGHVKFTDGRDTDTGDLRTYSIPSQSPAYKGTIVAGGGGVMKRRDTFVIPIADRMYEVGREVHRALSGRQETEVLDENFALSDQYAARLFGALNYMMPNLPADVIDILVLGLPLNTYRKLHRQLADRFTDTFTINDTGDRVTIRSCHVYPQPLVSYMSYIASNPTPGRTPNALSIDPGYNTVDWFVCQGMSANDTLSDAVQRGMGAVLRAIADHMIKTHGFDATPAELIRRIDCSLTTGEPFQLFGHDFDLRTHMTAGNDVIQEAAQTVKNSVGSGSEIDVIILSGGGASLYAEAIKDKFPKHKVVLLPKPALANVRGFHYIGEMLAKSLGQAMKLSSDAPVTA